MKSASVFLFFVFFSISVGADEPAVIFTADNRRVFVGETLSIDLVMTGFPESQGGGLNLSFDPRVVQVTGVAVDTSLWSFSHRNGQIDNEKGEVSNIIFAAFPGISGEGKIATVEFLGVRKGNVRLRLEESVMNPFSSNGSSLPVSLGKANLHVKYEPPRVYRRLHFLRGWSYEQDDQIFPGVRERAVRMVFEHQ